jgi:hypothetical protein
LTDLSSALGSGKIWQFVFQISFFLPRKLIYHKKILITINIKILEKNNYFK